MREIAKIVTDEWSGYQSLKEKYNRTTFKDLQILIMPFKS